MSKPDVRNLERERVRRKLAADLFGAAHDPVHVGRFEIRQHLGRGSFGVAYAAFDPTLKRQVGIKVLSGERDPEAALVEARALAGLSHPNILPVFETGMHEGLPFIVVELVAAGNLRAFRASLGADPLSARNVARLIDVLLQVAEGLSAAHARGLVHRDIKPENILMGADGRPKIADFGLAAAIAAPDAGTGGTPRYAPPEQAMGGLPDPRSDQFAFSVMSLELIGPACPTEVRSVLVKGMSASPEARHASMAELERKLRAARRGRGRVRAAGALLAGSFGAAALVALAAGGARGGPLATLEPADRMSAPSKPKAASASDIDKASQNAVRLLTAGDHRGCVDSLADDRGSAILSELRVTCARKLSTNELRAVCATHLARYKVDVDGCGAADLTARERSEAKDYAGCLRSVETLAWSPQRSILASECAQKLATRDGYRRLCEFMKKAPNAPQGGNCGGA